MQILRLMLFGNFWVWKLLSVIIINILGIFSLSGFRKKKWSLSKIPSSKKFLIGAFLGAAKQVVLKAWLCISRAVNNISTSQHFTSITIPKQQNPLLFNGWVPHKQTTVDETHDESLSGSFGRRLSMESSSIKGLPSETPTKKMNHVVLEKSGLEHPPKSKPVTHFGMQVYKKEVFQYEHFQSLGIFIFLGKQNIEACDTKPRKKVEQLLKYWFILFCLFENSKNLEKFSRKSFDNERIVLNE